MRNDVLLRVSQYSHEHFLYVSSMSFSVTSSITQARQSRMQIISNVNQMN